MRKEKVYQGRKFAFYSEDHQLPDGRVVAIDVLRHPGAVVILPIGDDGEVYLVKQYRPAIAQTILELPAGTLEPGEAPELCARRELSEEIGMQASEWIALGTLYPTPGFCDELQYLFLARGLSSLPGECDEDEVLEPVSLPMSELRRALVTGDLSDGKSMALLLRATAAGYFPLFDSTK